MIRAPRPKDLLTCLPSHSTPLYNVARTKDSLFNSYPCSPLITTLRQILFPEVKRHVLICNENNRLQGLLSSRPRAGATVWEIDQLLLPNGEVSPGASLLDNLGQYGIRIGMHKVFLRIEKDSSMVNTAQEAGFLLHGTEYLYRLEKPAGRAQPSLPPDSFRPKMRSDEFPLFRLYTAVTPPTLRHAEGMTLQEWQDSRERNRCEEIICQRGDSLVGWLRLSLIRGAGVFELMVLPSAENLEELLTEYSLARLSHASAAYCIAQEHQFSLRRLFTQKGFQLLEEYSVLLKQLTVAVHQPSLAPLRA